MNVMFACFNIGAVYQMREAWAETETIGQEALRVAQNSGLTAWEIMYTLWQGDLAYEQYNTAQGSRDYGHGLILSIQAQSQSGLSASLERLAYVALLRSDIEHAVTLFSAAQRYAEAEPMAMPNTPRHLTDAMREQLQIAYADASLTSWRTRGEHMTLEDLKEFVNHAAHLQRSTNNPND